MRHLPPPASPHRIVGLLRAIHPFPVAAVTSGSALLAAVALRSHFQLARELRVVLVVLCSQAAVGALNDLVDYQSDRLNQPTKPLACGQTSQVAVLSLAVACLAASTAIAAGIGGRSFLVFIVAMASALAYDMWLKPTPWAVACYILSFNGLVAWIWLVCGSFGSLPWLVWPGVVVVAGAAHLANSVPDIASDRRQGIRTLAVVLGCERAITLILGLYACTWASTVAITALRAPWLLPAPAASIALAVAAVWAVRRGSPERASSIRFYRLMMAAFGLASVSGLATIT